MSERRYKSTSGRSRNYSIDYELCDIELSTEIQEQDLEKSALFAEIWLNQKYEKFNTDTPWKYLTYAFRIAKLRIECRKCKIDGRNRGEVIAHTIDEITNTIKSTEDTINKKAAVNLEIEKILQIIDANMSIRKELTGYRQIVKKSEGKITRVYRSVFSAGRDSWNLVGLHNENGTINEQVCGEIPICYIIEEEPGCTISASIEVDLRDLWVDIDKKPISLPDQEPKEPDKKNNRRAVCHALVARRIKKKGKKHSSDVNFTDGVGRIELARSTIKWVGGVER